MPPADGAGRRARDDAAVRLLAFTCGQITLPLSYFLPGEEGRITIPFTAYLIDHPLALCLFDTGLGAKYRRAFGTAAAGRVDFSEHETMAARLLAIGVDPREIRWIINSHLHLDHAGGNEHFPNATVIVQDEEWDYAFAGVDPSYVPAEVDTGQPLKRIRGELDLFGDGTVVLLPTPGHVPGHQSARVRTGGGEALLAGDCCNLKRSLDELRLPESCHDADQYPASLKTLRRRRAGGTAIFYSHDPTFWATVPQAVPLDLQAMATA